MITIDLDPMLIHIGPLALSWYGLAVAAALLVGIWLTRREARRRGIDPDAVSDIALWVALGGLVGARLLHVLDRWPEYAADPGRILAVQNGGLAIQGAILGGLATGAVLAARRGLPLLRLSDAAAPGVVLGQAIGRLGCLVTGDAVGPATGGAWGIVYRNPGAMAPQLGVAYQPTFLYEAAWDVLIFTVLWATRGRLRRDGQAFALYLSMYGAGKFALTFLRNETVWLLGLQEAQLVALGLVAVGAAWAAAAVRTTNRTAAHA
jgi:phosphatidylglycerol---prolipoprotein diacylglyceryl transferase